MTVAYERRRAIEAAGEMLRALRRERSDTEVWGGPVPEKLRDLAASILRHYPEPWQIADATEMDDLAVCDWIAKEPSK
jgi:hypothetical protein